ncbi:MAG: hypothetical protein DRQ63_00205 [Gammaproteobacteria bacterium]|nr:MAG: hypothetical protein DRQ63_00205 [Gammaproteobacteria bacterium]
MKRFLTWLTDRFSAESKVPVKPGRVSPLRSMPKAPLPKSRKPTAIQPQAVEFAGEVEGRIIDGGPGKNVLVRNKYLREDTGTHDTLKIVDDSLLKSTDEDGIDPYNTGRFDRSRSWDSSRSRK